MKKIITYGFLALNLMINTETCYGSGSWFSTSWLREWFETSEQKLARTINLSPLAVLEAREEKIRTKSQKPIKTVHRQNISQLSILATAIKENSIQKEVVTRKILKGRDGRKQIQETNVWPNSIHGTVFMTFPSTKPDTYQWGTGTLIASNLVLTAAHNLYDNKIKEEVTQVRFCPAMNGNKPLFGEPKVIKYYFPAAYKNSKEEDFSLDYGLLVLEQAVGIETGYFGLSIISEAALKTKTINITGYPADKVENKPFCYEMWTMAGPVKNIQHGIIHYEIDTYGGQSGSGVWYKNGGDYFVTGVHVGGDTMLGINYAVLLTREHYEQIINWAKDYVSDQISKGMLDELFSTVTILNLKNIWNIGAQLLTNDKFPHLTSLNLRYNKIGDEGAKEVTKITNLTKLDLSSNNIGAAGLMEVAKITSLTKLNLSSNNIGSAGVMELAKSISLMKLDLDNNNIGATEAMELAKITNLTKLDLNNNKIGDEGATEVAKITNLNTLSLRWNNIGTAGAMEVVKIINLTKLNLSNNNIGTAGAMEVAKITSLTKLNLQGNNIGDTGAMVLTKITNLTKLDLGLNKISDLGVIELAKITNLNTLNLWYNKISEAGAIELAKITNLNTLYLRVNNIGDLGAIELAKITNLNILYLGENKIGDLGAIELAKLTNLNILYLGQNKIGVLGAIELAKLTNLNTLNLEYNEIGDAGAKELAKIINLTKLNLDNNNIGSAGAKELTKLTNLTTLDLKYNNVGDLGAIELAKTIKLNRLYLWHNNIGWRGRLALRSNSHIKDLSL